MMENYKPLQSNALQQMNTGVIEHLHRHAATVKWHHKRPHDLSAEGLSKKCRTECATENRVQCDSQGRSSVQKYLCHLCAATFPQKCDLDRHVSSHLQIRQFLCWICGKQFIQKAHLNMHLNFTHAQQYSQSVLKLLATQFCDESVPKTEDMESAPEQNTVVNGINQISNSKEREMIQYSDIEVPNTVQSTNTLVHNNKECPVLEGPNSMHYVAIPVMSNTMLSPSSGSVNISSNHNQFNSYGCKGAEGSSSVGVKASNVSVTIVHSSQAKSRTHYLLDQTFSQRSALEKKKNIPHFLPSQSRSATISNLAPNTGVTSSCQMVQGLCNTSHTIPPMDLLAKRSMDIIKSILNEPDGKSTDKNRLSKPYLWASPCSEGMQSVQKRNHMIEEGQIIPTVSLTSYPGIHLAHCTTMTSNLTNHHINSNTSLSTICTAAPGNEATNLGPMCTGISVKSTDQCSQLPTIGSTISSEFDDSCTNFQSKTLSISNYVCTDSSDYFTTSAFPCKEGTDFGDFTTASSEFPTVELMDSCDNITAVASAFPDNELAESASNFITAMTESIPFNEIRDCCVFTTAASALPGTEFSDSFSSFISTMASVIPNKEHPDPFSNDLSPNFSMTLPDDLTDSGNLTSLPTGPNNGLCSFGYQFLSPMKLFSDLETNSLNVLDSCFSETAVTNLPTTFGKSLLRDAPMAGLDEDSLSVDIRAELTAATNTLVINAPEIHDENTMDIDRGNP